MVYIGIGGKRIGKTYQSSKMIDVYSKGIPSIGQLPRKVLIFDLNNEYSQYKSIASDPDTISKFNVQNTVEIRRISVFKSDGKVKSTLDNQTDLINILDNFRHGLLLLEDLALLVGDSQTVKFIGALSTNRHKDLDIVIHYQSIAQFTNPKMFALKNVLRLHKTNDSVSRNTPKKNSGEYYNLIRIAEIIINKRYQLGIDNTLYLESKGKIDTPEYKNWENNYVRIFLHINFDTYKITGNYTQKEFVDACSQYLQEEQKHEIKPLLEYKDIKTGKKLYDFQSAFTLRLKELYQKFYGNKKP